MLSKETQQKLDRLYALMDQRIAIDEKIEALFSDATSIQQAITKWHKGRKPKHKTLAAAKPKGRPAERGLSLRLRMHRSRR